MVSFYKYVLLLIASFTPIICEAQYSLDTLLLNEIVVVEKVDYAKVPGQSSQDLSEIKDKSSPIQNLGEALEQNTSISIRSYGLSGISSASVRGAGASHTGVVWNGINIQNIQNGQFNFSSIPIASTDKIILVKGGTGAQVGSGSIGGTVFIDNKLQLKDCLKAELSATAGMFNQYGQYLLVEKSTKKFASRLMLLNSFAENNFTYINTARFGKPVDTVSNGGFSKKSAISNTKVLISHNSSIDVHIWLSKQHNEDPGTMVVAPKGHYINDDNLRSAVHWEWYNNSLAVDFRTAYLYGHMKYAGDIVSNHHTNNQINEISFGQNNTAIKWKASLSQSYEWMTSTDLQNKPDRQKNSIYGIGKYNWKRIETALIIRQELVEGKLIPFTPALGIDYSMNDKVVLSSFVSRSYRLPSFNDLHWVGWGNPKLLPEDAVNKEITIKYANKKESMQYTTSFSAFHNNIRDMIVWMPQGAIWKPENSDSVLSYGVETEISLLVQKREERSFGLQLHYSWTRSLSNGFEMIYVPNHKATLVLLADIKGYFLNYNHSLTSFRYTNKHNTEWVDGFNVANISCGKTFEYQKYQIKISGVMRNIYNSEYQIIKYYPTPLRSYEITLTLKYKQ